MLWPGLDPIGHRFRFQEEQFTVIGLAREIHHPSVDGQRDRPEFYEVFSGVNREAMMSLRCGGPCPAAALVRQRIISAQPSVHVIDVRSLEDVYVEDLARPRAAAALSVAFAGVAILAAAGGLVSVLSFAVSRRAHEFGIRTALGASPAQMQQVVLREGIRLAALGVAMGTVAAIALARTLASLAYGVTVTDPWSWLLVLGLVGATTIAAAWWPSRQAMHADPALLLRAD
jgi:predicted lysophospholipase L1 biosynthesis ABC-type transport system permease subunit